MNRQKILLTGGSSFTGYWFVRALADAGHEITAIFTREDIEAYGADLRGSRVRKLQEYCRPVFNCRFGDDRFLRLVKSASPDVFCHHGADVTNYRSPEFDFNRAVANNTHRLHEVLNALQDVDCGKVVLTGTVFEGGEGAGSDNLPHFSPYGLSKSQTAGVFKHFCQQAGLALGKFVVPNPFGPFEEPRFTAYLVRCWRAGETPCIQTPAYIRDNIHVTLLAKHYARFVADLPSEAGL
ncbi:MAG: NAD-dependent epimerase/dehydratase family protein, partial [Bythopirellula sp.]